MKIVPDIRFKGFEEEWRLMHISDFLQVNKTMNTDNIYGREDVLSVSDECGIVNQIKFLGRSYAGKSVLKYKVVHPHQIVYTKSPLKDKPYGIVKQSGISGIVSSLYAVYDVMDSCIPSYIQWYYEPYYRINSYLRPLVNKGAKNTINISDVNAISGRIFFPNIDEQQLISNYLILISDYIRETSKKVKSLRQLKSACLISMFPQQGETVPRVRFKGFDGEWKICELKQFAFKVTRKNCDKEFTKTFTNSAEFGVINQNEYFDRTISNSENIGGYYVVENNDYIYNPRVSTLAPVGPINRNKLGYTGVVSPLYLVFKTNNIDKDYLDVFFNTNLWHRYMKLEGNCGARFDRLSISDELFFEMPIILPSNEAEQHQIASYFRNLDIQISEQEKRLEKLKQIKAACLDKMFV